jgi:hypothetical protein
MYGFFYKLNHLLYIILSTENIKDSLQTSLRQCDKNIFMVANTLD